MLTVTDVSERLNVHPKTVRRWLRDGRLKGTKLPTGQWGRGAWRVTEEDLREFLNGSNKDD